MHKAWAWAGEEVAPLGIGSAWPPGGPGRSFNLIDRAKLLFVRDTASIDGFVERIVNAHLVNTIQSSWVLWGRISLCSLQRIRI
jgi:hypothetical protein